MQISIFGRSLQPQLQTHSKVSRCSTKMFQVVTFIFGLYLKAHAQNLVEGQNLGPIEVTESTVFDGDGEQLVEQNDAESLERPVPSWEYLKAFGFTTELFQVAYFEGSRVYVRGVGLLVLLTLGLWLASDHLGIWRTLRGASKTRGVRQLLEGFEAKQVIRKFKNQQISKPSMP